MSLIDQVINALSTDDAQALTARDIFKSCQDAETIIQVSTVLSQLFIKGKIFRKSVNLGTTKYAYWKKEDAAEKPNPVAIRVEEKPIVESTPQPKVQPQKKELLLLENRNANAPQILANAINCIGNRAQERDQPNGERSMTKAVNSFNALTGHKLTEREGWVFMAILKLSRSQAGRHQLDDYVDGCAYIALAGESAEGTK